MPAKTDTAEPEAPPAEGVDAVPTFSRGQLVTHTFEDMRHPTAEPRTLLGLVVDVDADAEHVSVVWLPDAVARMPFHQVSG